MTPCNDCNALTGALATTEPHSALRMEISVATLSGIREEFKCVTCGAKIHRFRATQTNPPPSDVWRFG